MVHHAAPECRPGDLYGRRKQDPLLRAADMLFSLYVRALEFRPKSSRELAVDTGSHRVTVSRKSVEARDELVACLELTGEGALPPWHPGAHLDVTLPSGRMRQYSLCGDPADLSSYRIAVRLVPDGDGGSREIHESVTVGCQLQISSPRNAFPFTVGSGRFRPRRLRFVAAGIGVTPILPMVATADALGVDWSMVYLGRTAESLAFLGEVSRYGSRVRVRLDAEHGFPTAVDILGDVPDGTEVYCCGPVPVLEMLRSYVRDRGDIGFHYERFSPPPIIDGKDFQIELADGTTVEVPANRTALEAVRAVRPDILYSCRQGFCGTCRVPVSDGTPVHHGAALTTEQQQDHMLLCVSRADGGRIVIDL